MTLIMIAPATIWSDNIQLGDGWYWYCWGDAGNDVINGGNDGNVLYGGDGNDTVYGGSHSDGLYGDAGDDRLSGGAGADDLYGGLGRDTLYGGADGDYLHGGSGADRIVGGAGYDRMWGDSGADTFVFTSSADSPHTRSVYDYEPNGIDIIEDFARGYDKIDLSAIDADPTVAGNQAFAFLGELIPNYYTVGVSIHRSYNALSDSYGWEVDVSNSRDGDLPELQIFIAGDAPLTASDFIL